MTTLNIEVGPKQLQLLHELAPSAAIIAALVNPNSPGAEVQTRDLPLVAGALGLQLHVLGASVERDFEAAFVNLRQLGAGALMITQDAFLNSRSAQLATLTVRHAMPAIHPQREFAAAGGLMSYGNSFMDAYTAASANTPAAFSRVRNRPSCQCSRLPRSSSPSISRRPRHSASQSRLLPLLGRADEVIE